MIPIITQDSLVVFVHPKKLFLEAPATRHEASMKRNVIANRRRRSKIVPERDPKAT